MGRRRPARARSVAVVAAGAVALAVAAAALVAGPVAGHTNHVAADPQVVAADRVVVEAVFAGDEAWLAVHADDGGEPGRVLGTRQVDGDAGFLADVTVEVSDDWADEGPPRSAWALLHTSDGDGEFDPEEDEAVESFGSPVGERFAVEPGAAPAVVTAETFSPQDADNGTVTVRRASLPAAGHVAIHADDDGPGRVVGDRSLAAGTHRNVSVAVAPSALAGEDAVALWAVVHADDGDGSFDDGDDPLRVGDGMVATKFGASGGPDATATPDATGGEGGAGTPTGTDGPTASDTPSATGAGDADDDGSDGAATGGSGPGVGPVGVVAALLALAALARLRRAG